METKPLLYGIIGFLMGGLVVSVAASTFEKPTENASMVSSLDGKSGEEFDKAFVNGMIDHHQDAIDMARKADAQSKHQEIKDLAKAIIDTQQKEIDTMKQWQQAWGYSAVDADSMSH